MFPVIKTPIKHHRLSIDIPPELHVEIKSQAAFKGITIRKYVIRAILEKIKKDRHYQV
jgi:predicted HicB family RNase H-like nuclease